ncbi:MAG: DUF5615 family PIN-like protein [Acidimicrobiales bacterium]
MRFLVDECLSPRLAELLTEAGHDALHARSLGLISAPDPIVLAQAADDTRVLLTLDTDFGELLARERLHRPSVILFRGEISRRAANQATVLLANLEHLGHDLDAGAVVVIGDGRIRLRSLPLIPED